MDGAAVEKTRLEEKQRESSKARKDKSSKKEEKWKPRSEPLFRLFRYSLFGSMFYMCQRSAFTRMPVQVVHPGHESSHQPGRLALLGRLLGPQLLGARGHILSPWPLLLRPVPVRGGVRSLPWTSLS